MSDEHIPWRTFLARYLRLGFLGFGGPPAHTLLLRQQWVDTDVIDVSEFNDAFAAVSLLPGPASTQLALWVGWRTRGVPGLFAAAALFITPAVAMVLLLSWLVLGEGHPEWLNAAALGAAAVVPAVALRAGVDIARGYRIGELPHARQWRLGLYGVAGIVVCLTAASALPFAMILAGLCELVVRREMSARPAGWLGLGSTKTALAWMALKVGALSFGGGFVIVPIMRGDAVTAHHWLTASAFVTAVAIGQLTPGPVVATVAAVGYAAAGWQGGLLAAAIAFAPSLLFVGVGARHLTRLRSRAGVRAFFDGAAPVATGAIVAASVILARSCTLSWQWPIIGVGVVAVVLARRSPTWWLLAGTGVGLLLGVFAHVPLA